MASFRMTSMGNRYQQYIKHRGRTVYVLDTNIRFIPSFCFMTLSMMLSCLIHLLVIFSKSYKVKQLLLYAHGTTHLVPSLKSSESLLKILPVKKYCPVENCVDCIF